MNDKKQTIEITCQRDAFVAWTNTDKTEGRGWVIPYAVCQKQATAIRVGKSNGVMGTDCHVTTIKVFEVGGKWYGPIHFVESTVEDDREQLKLDKKRAAIEKAKAAGLTDDEIKAIYSY